MMMMMILAVLGGMLPVRSVPMLIRTLIHRRASMIVRIDTLMQRRRRPRTLRQNRRRSEMRMLPPPRRRYRRQRGRQRTRLPARQLITRNQQLVLRARRTPSIRVELGHTDRPLKCVRVHVTRRRGRLESRRREGRPRMMWVLLTD